MATTILASGARTGSGVVDFADVGLTHMDQFRDCVLHCDLSAATTAELGVTLGIFLQSGLVGADSTMYHDFAHVQFNSTGVAPLHRHAHWSRGSMEFFSTQAVETQTYGTMPANEVHQGPVGESWQLYWVVSATSAPFTFSVEFEGRRFGT